jgi:hypothetical protein
MLVSCASASVVNLSSDRRKTDRMPWHDRRINLRAPEAVFSQNFSKCLLGNRQVYKMRTNVNIIYRQTTLSPKYKHTDKYINKKGKKKKRISTAQILNITISSLKFTLLLSISPRIRSGSHSPTTTTAIISSLLAADWTL